MWKIQILFLVLFQEHSRVVRLPVNVYELLGKINKVAQRLNAEPGRRSKATYDEIGGHLPPVISASINQHKIFNPFCFAVSTGFV